MLKNLQSYVEPYDMIWTLYPYDEPKYGFSFQIYELSALFNCQTV